jgi:hypothetical protein
MRGMHGARAHKKREPTRRGVRLPRHSRVKSLDEDATPEPPFDLVRDLPGAVFMVPNKQWGFVNRNSAGHPGACIHSRPEQWHAVFLKGTDAVNIRGRRQFDHHFVSESPANGLKTQTAFELAPRYLPLHKVRLLYPERRIGRLDDVDLNELRARLAYIFDED